MSRSAARILILVSVSVLFWGCSLGGNSKFNLQDSSKDATTTSDEFYAAIRSGAIKCEPGELACMAPSAGVRRLPAPPLEVTKEVKLELNEMLKWQGASIKDGLSRRNQNYPLLARIFDDEGVPRDLINLAMVESGFRTDARSPVGAIGMWQFMKPTAKNYGLRVNVKEDQRKDLVLSTIAAARHLKDLFVEHGDWYLALAAYNAGSGGVTRALMRSGAENFWHMARSGKLTQQTSRFVPRFIAATMLAKTYDRYGADNLEGNVKLHIASASKPGENDRFALNSEEIDDKRISYWTGDGHPSPG